MFYSDKDLDTYKVHPAKISPFIDGGIIVAVIGKGDVMYQGDDVSILI